MNWLEQEQLVQRAKTAYFRRFGAVANISSNASRVVERAGVVTVELINVSGLLAAYRYDPKTDRLDFIELGG